MPVVGSFMALHSITLLSYASAQTARLLCCALTAAVFHAAIFTKACWMPLRMQFPTMRFGNGPMRFLVIRPRTLIVFRKCTFMGRCQMRERSSLKRALPVLMADRVFPRLTYSLFLRERCW